MKATDILLLGGLGYAAYWIYTNWGKTPAPVANAEQGIANVIANLTSPSQVQVSSSLVVQFPDGTQLPAANVINGPMTWQGNVPTFQYNGSTWSLAPQVNGVYQATQLSGLGSYSAPRARGLSWNDDPFIRSLGCYR